MSADNFEHKDELDCEVTVFEGAHSTCDQTDDQSHNKQTAEKTTASKKEAVKDNYNI